MVDEQNNMVAINFFTLQLMCKFCDEEMGCKHYLRENTYCCKEKCPHIKELRT